MATIFDSGWFALERPAFERIAALSDVVLTWALVALGLVAIAAAINPRTPAIMKAVMIAYAVLP